MIESVITDLIEEKMRASDADPDDDADPRGDAPGRIQDP
jgi:hypothetical protein